MKVAGSSTILGIESSCDETAAAVYHTHSKLLSSTLFSQTEAHKRFGGVVPEISSRLQIEKIQSVVQQALVEAQVSLKDIDAIAVTNRPGLPGSLLVGVCFAKSVAYALNTKIIGINHLEGHAFSSFIENSVPFPHLCLTASGGHTSLYYISDYGIYTVLGQTLDDAAGEAFDKVAKLLNLPYPGGPVIEQLAQEVGFQDFFHYPRLKGPSLDMSFSGIKTAVLYDLVKRGYYDLPNKKFLAPDNIELKQQVASSLLVCIGDIFQQKLARAFKAHPHVQAITFVGGVACNKYLQHRLKHFAESQNLPFFAPSRAYCTDNAAMIAFVGHYKAQQGHFDDLTLDIY
jgi:N6-L-threonylcarbamoyladenine synthase